MQSRPRQLLVGNLRPFAGARRPSPICGGPRASRTKALVASCGQLLGGTLETTGSTFQKRKRQSRQRTFVFGNGTAARIKKTCQRMPNSHEPLFTQRAGLKLGGPGHDTANAEQAPTAAHLPPLPSAALLPLPLWGTRRAACRGGWGVGQPGLGRPENLNSASAEPLRRSESKKLPTLGESFTAPGLSRSPLQENSAFSRRSTALPGRSTHGRPWS